MPLPPRGRAAVVVPVLLRHRARPRRLREVPARVRQAHLADSPRRSGISTTPPSTAAPRPSTTRITSPSPSTTTAGGSALAEGEAEYDELEKRLAAAPRHRRADASRSRATPTVRRTRSERLRQEVLRQVRAPDDHRRHRPQPAAGSPAGLCSSGDRGRSVCVDVTSSVRRTSPQSPESEGIDLASGLEELDL